MGHVYAGKNLHHREAMGGADGGKGNNLRLSFVEAIGGHLVPHRRGKIRGGNSTHGVLDFGCSVVVHGDTRNTHTGSFASYCRGGSQIMVGRARTSRGGLSAGYGLGGKGEAFGGPRAQSSS